jgi:hypothetical protein
VRAAVGRPLPLAVAVLVAVVLGALFVVPDADDLGATLGGVEYQADLYHDLGRAIDEAGGAERLKACGQPYTGAFLVPQVAWRLGVHGTDIDLRPQTPAVVFHVRTVKNSPVAPALDRARPNMLAREGHWAITADCGPAR